MEREGCCGSDFLGYSLPTILSLNRRYASAEAEIHLNIKIVQCSFDLVAKSSWLKARNEAK